MSRSSISLKMIANRKRTRPSYNWVGNLSFAHCNHVYDAQAIGTCPDYLIATGHVLRKIDGVPVCSSWWLQQRWYKDFRYGIGFGNPSNEEMSRYMSHQRRQKSMIIDALTYRYTIKQLLPSLHMAKSSYFYQFHAMEKDEYELTRKELRKVFSVNRQCYGYRRLHTALTCNGRIISEKGMSYKV